MLHNAAAWVFQMYCFPYVLSLCVPWGVSVLGFLFLFSLIFSLQIFIRDTVCCLSKCKGRGMSFEQGNFF